ncbi:MAG: hypothetical protein ACTSR2_05870 [Candidatus Hodarchaeales archaeon]
MEIEYENKETITWCLDREGPRICLLAIRENNKLKKMKIDSESFKLEIEGDEADSFLRVLQHIVGVKREEPAQKEVETELIPETKHVEVVDEVFEERKERYEPITESPPPVIEEPRQEQTFAGSIEEQSVTPASIPTGEARKEIVEEPKVEEKIKAPEIPATSEILQILKKSEKTVGRLLKEEVEDDTIDPLEDTASFFRQASEKSPLEELLDEEGKIKDELAEEPPARLSEESNLHKIFKPNDLQTKSFISQFEKENPLEHLTKTEEPTEEGPVESKVVTEEKEGLSEKTSSKKQEEYVTEAERRAAIERERAERRRRLWELTRGF